MRAFAILYGPEPSQISERIDYFGNWAEHFTILTPHAEMCVTSRSEVEVEPRLVDIDSERSVPWEAVRDSLVYRKGTGAGEAAQFAYASPYTTIAPELAAFARDAFAPGRPVVAAAVALMHRIFSEFTFDPSSTTITTPVTRCWPIATASARTSRTQIWCMRSLGLPARYVSGYLLTTPPPGKPRLSAPTPHTRGSQFTVLCWDGSTSIRRTT